METIGGSVLWWFESRSLHCQFFSEVGDRFFRVNYLGM